MMEHNHFKNNNENKTLFVIVLTVITMFAEVLFGFITNSMALLADGYHMGTHVIALSLTYVAYVLIRKFKDSPLFPNGTGNIGTLAAYTSSLFLGFTGIWIISEAMGRFIAPLNIEFNEAILVAVIGLTVNTICIFIMEIPEIHHKNEEDDVDKKDYNFKSAYYHILADILTSVLAIIALFAGKFFDLYYLDPIVGIVGGFLIIRWAISLIKNTVVILIGMKKSDNN